jgi:hypothetical protein
MSFAISPYKRAGLFFFGVCSVIYGISSKRFFWLSSGAAALTLAYKLPALVASVKERSRIDQLIDLSCTLYHPKTKGQYLSQEHSDRLARLDKILIDCTRSATLEQAVQALSRVISKDSSVKAALVEDPLKQGFSGNPVYLITDASGKLILVVKAFTEKKVFLQELYGINNLQRRHLKNAQGVAFQDGGYFRDYGKEYFLLATSPAPGLHLIDVIDELSKRHDQLDNAMKCVQVYARALGELHSQKPSRTKLSPAFCNELARDYHHNVRTIEKSGIHIDSRNSKLFYQLFEKVRSLDVQKGRTHLDLTPKNVFCDLSNDRAILIDCGSMAIGYKFPGYDFITAAYYLAWQLKVRKISPELVQQLMAQFRDSYLASGGTLPSDEEETFYTAFLAVDTLSSWCTSSKDNDHGQGRITLSIDILKKLRWEDKPLFEIAST